MEEKFYFCEECALTLFRAYKEKEDLAALNELLKLCLPIVERLITRWHTARLEALDELRSLVLRRLSRSLQRLYDPDRGRLFTFVTKSTESALIDAVRRKRSGIGRFVTLEDAPSVSLSVNGQEHGEAIDDIRFRITRIKTVSTCPREKEAQRWLVKNLVASNFVFRRHEAADAMTIVYGLSPERSRKLYDITLLSIRRELIVERKLKPVQAETLVGTRAKALLRYRERLSEADFSRLVFLMANLAPAIIETGEFSLSEILYGSSRETPLFSGISGYN